MGSSPGEQDVPLERAPEEAAVAAGDTQDGVFFPELPPKSLGDRARVLEVKESKGVQGVQPRVGVPGEAESSDPGH